MYSTVWFIVHYITSRFTSGLIPHMKGFKH